MQSLAIWTIRLRRKSTLWWLAGIIVFITLNLVFYPSLREQTAQLEQSLEQIPEAMRGFLSDTGEFITPIGYLSSQIYYLMLPLLLCIFSISLGSSLIGKEERDGTLDLLLTRPISRTGVLAGKMMGAFLLIALFGIVALVTIFILTRIVDLPVSASSLALATSLSVLFSILIGLVALLLTCLGKVRGAGVGVAAIVGFSGYILSSLVPSAAWLEWPAKLFPFYYYRPGQILNGDADLSNMLVLFLLTICLVIGCFLAFRKRDIDI